VEEEDDNDDDDDSDGDSMPLTTKGRKGMTPVCKPSSPVTLWVANEIAMDRNLGYKECDFLN
jgi:hypothetical protein